MNIKVNQYKNFLYRSARGLSRVIPVALMLGCGSQSSEEPPPGPFRDYLKEWYGDGDKACLPAGCGVTPVEVAAGYQHSCARMQDGSVRCWGLDDYSQLAGSSLSKAVVGVQEAVRIATNTTASCAVIRGGTVKCWGLLPLDRIKADPVNTTLISTTPTVVSALAEQPAGQLIARGNLACAILATDEARATCWGTSNYLFGALWEFAEASPTLINQRILSLTNANYNYGIVRFDGSANSCNFGKQSNCLVPLGNSHDITQLAQGNRYGLALLRDGTLHPYGTSEFVPCAAVAANGGFQAAPANYCKAGNPKTWLDAEPWPGLNDIIDVQVSQPMRFLSGNPAEIAFTCALRRDGEVLCWGNNNYGQRGTMEVVEKGYPYPPPTADLTTVPGLHEVAQMSLGSTHSCALTKKKEIYCWGQNGPEQQLGDARKSGAPPTSPVVFPP